jgi:acetyltransferase-like isoleucine patch superfamily enzyme
LRFGAGVTFGRDSLVDALSVTGVELGANTSIGRNTRIECTGNLRTIGRGLCVGDNVGLGTDCFYGCGGGITIGDDTIVGNYVTFHSENHQVDNAEKPIRAQGVTRVGISIGNNCWIGAKATILDGANVGDGCVIAAGSVVLAGDYAPNGIFGGTPARLLRSRL